MEFEGCIVQGNLNAKGAENREEAQSESLRIFANNFGLFAFKSIPVNF
jgi:hypothetical protein